MILSNEFHLIQELNAKQIILKDSSFALTDAPENSEMNNTKKRTSILAMVGWIALISGAIDPLEGSLAIAIGSILICLDAWRRGSAWRFLYAIASGLILIGVFFLFYISSRGGIEGNLLKSPLSLLIAPYPIGWLVFVFSFVKTQLEKSISRRK